MKDNMKKLLLWFKTKRKLVNACHELGKKLRKAEIEDKTFRVRAFDAEYLLRTGIRETFKDLLKEHDRKHGTSTYWEW